jgi:hypothetical protein
VKKPSGGSTTVSGPSLTASQKAARDRAEAGKARGEAAKAREEAAKAGAEARKDEARARADRKRGEPAFARQEMKQARGDLAREKRDLARAGRDSARSQRDLARARTAGLARAGRAGEWILGGNDQYLTCAAAAVANSLLLATGQRVSDEDALGLHRSAGGTEVTGTSVLAALEAAQPDGLSGWRPAFGPIARDPGAGLLRAVPVGPLGELPFQRAPLDSLAPARAARSAPGAVGAGRQSLAGAGAAAGDLESAKHPHGLIVELALPGGIHAVLLADGFAVTWSRAIPVTQTFLEQQTVAAWQITWG